MRLLNSIALLMLAGCHYEPVMTCWAFKPGQGLECPAGMKVECVCVSIVCGWGCK